MKKIFIALAAILAVQVVGAQVKTPEAAFKAVQSAEAAAQDAKKATKVATWLKLADAYMDAYNAPAGAAWLGATKTELQLIMGSEKPKTIESVTLGADAYLKEVYSNKDMYFNQNGQLVMIIVTKPVVANALDNALDAYKKAYEVDVKQSKVKDISEGIGVIAAKYVEEGLNKYTLGDYASASELFEKGAIASETAPFSKVNAEAYYNAAFTAWYLKDYQKAKELFEKCLALEYYYEGGEVFAKLADVYTHLENKEATKKILEDGFQKFPESQSILIGLINYYLTNNEDPNRLFELIAMAKKNEPNNASLYYVEGNIYLEIAKNDPSNIDNYMTKASESYDMCAKINPEYEFGYIGKGQMFYNRAVELQEQGANELDDAKYQQILDKFEAALKSAIQPFEEAYKVSKDDSIKVTVAEYLKNIYYRFSSDSDEYMNAYKKYNEVVKTGKPL